MFRFIASTLTGSCRLISRYCLRSAPTQAVIAVAAVFMQIQSFSIAKADEADPADRPNVVLIMADDLGYQDLSCYGSTRIKTPNLDLMSRDGIRLTSFYAGATVCTPSRMALLTGAYPTRVGWRGGVVGYGMKVVNGLAPEAVTIAEIFKDSGYRTAIFGKWHLGDLPEMGPLEQGFDEAFFINKSNNQTKKLWRDTELVADPFDNRRLTEQFITEAIEFISSPAEKPFLAYLPLTAPHFPAEAHPDWQGKSSHDAYGDVVQELDGRIGDLLDSLHSLQIDRKTIVVFLSDNGPEPGQRRWASSAPYRGLKWSVLEGGTRVPCIIRWPGVIPAGTVSDRLTGAIDLLPTLAHACNVSWDPAASQSPKVDGVNVWQSLIHPTGTPHPREQLLFWDGWAKPQAIRVGQWKLYFDSVKGIDDSESGPVLFHLTEDPAERTNLRESYPVRVKKMKELAAKELARIYENTIPLGGRPLEPQSTQPAKWLE